MKMIIPNYVIEEAVDNYLSTVFSREVVWEDCTVVNKYKVFVEEFFHPPHEIDFEGFEVEDEW